MPYTPLQISIPEPCHVPWNGMTPVTDNTRHCADCDKVITDFSHMTDAQIGRTLAANGGKLCGRFRHDQLDRPLNLNGPRRRGALGTFAAATSMLLAVPVFGQGAAMEEVEQVVSIKPSAPSADGSRTVEISGKITDGAGEGLIGANILVKNSCGGTVTDINGNYSLHVTAFDGGSVTLVVSYTGFLTTEHEVSAAEINEAVDAKLAVDVAIEEAAAGLLEVYVAGGAWYKPYDPLDHIMVHPVNTFTTYRPNGYPKGDWKQYWRDLFAARKARRAERKAERIAQRAARKAAHQAALQEETRPLSPAPESSPRTSGPAPNLDLAASPNPFGQELTVRFVLPSAQRVRLALFDANGRVVLEQPYDRPAGEQSIRLDKMPLKLPAGTYFLRLVTADGTTETVTLVR